MLPPRQVTDIADSLSSGKLVRWATTRKCPGLRRVRSFGSSDKAVRVREFWNASTWVSRLIRSSKVNVVISTIQVKFYTAHASLLKSKGRIICHVNASEFASSGNFDWCDSDAKSFLSSRSSCWVPINVAPLSEYKFKQFPLRAINIRGAAIKAHYLNCWQIQDALPWQLGKWKRRHRTSLESCSWISWFDIKWSCKIHTTIQKWPCRLYWCCRKLLRCNSPLLAAR